MSTEKNPRYYIVEASMLPEVFIKVMKAKILLETGESATVSEAVSKAGISRSAFYKYKDSVSLFQNMKSGHIITLSIMLRNTTGALSSVLALLAESGANILTINQSIPTNGAAAVTVSADTAQMRADMESLIESLKRDDGVLRVEILAG